MPSALLVIDVQQGLCSGDEAAFDIGNVIGRINGLIEKARSASVRVVIVQHEEKEGMLQFQSAPWQVADGVAAQPGDTRVRKSVPDSFEGTNLEALLRERGVDRVVVCGLQTDCCVNATVRGAAARGYAVTLASDSHSTVDSQGLPARDIIAQHNTALAQLAASGSRVLVKPAAEVRLQP
jgi:nicotinamidase-related amidase